MVWGAGDECMRMSNRYYGWWYMKAAIDANFLRSDIGHNAMPRVSVSVSVCVFRSIRFDSCSFSFILDIYFMGNVQSINSWTVLLYSIVRGRSPDPRTLYLQRISDIAIQGRKGGRTKHCQYIVRLKGFRNLLSEIISLFRGTIKINTIRGKFFSFFKFLIRFCLEQYTHIPLKYPCRIAFK